MGLFSGQVGWVAGYTDCISAERQDSSNECPVYNTKQSESEAPVMHGSNRTKLCTHSTPNSLK